MLSTFLFCINIVCHISMTIWDLKSLLKTTRQNILLALAKHSIKIYIHFKFSNHFILHPIAGIFFFLYFYSFSVTIKCQSKAEEK